VSWQGLPCSLHRCLFPITLGDISITPEPETQGLGGGCLFEIWQAGLHPSPLGPRLPAQVGVQPDTLALCPF
jgi:hypothetical protein